MKHIRTFFLLTIALILACSSLMSSTAYATAGRLYFDPGARRFDPGSTFTIAVKTDVAAPIAFFSGATLTVTFPKNILKATAISPGTALGTATTKTIDNTNGKIDYSTVAFGPVGGSGILVFNVTFQAIGTGDATLSFAAGSNVNDGPTTLQSTTYTIQPAACPAGQVGTPPNCSTPPPATCPAGQVGTPPNCSTPPPVTPTPPSTPAPDLSSLINPIIVPTTPDPEPVSTATGSLSITNVKSSPYWKTATLSWGTSAPDVTTVVQFGTAKDKLTTTLNAQLQTDGTFQTSRSNLEPGVRYYYMITAISTSSGGQATYSGSFMTHGYPAKLTITQNGQPAGGAAVKLSSGTYNANANGVIQFELPSGEQKATITANDGTTKSVDFTIKKVSVPSTGKAPETQNFEFDIGNPSTSVSANIWPIIGGILLLLLLIGLLFGFLLWRRKRAEEGPLPVATADEYAWSSAPSTVQSVEQQYIPEAEHPYAELGTENAQDVSASMAQVAFTNPIEQSPGTAYVPPIEPSQDLPFAQPATDPQPLPQAQEYTAAPEDLAANPYLQPLAPPPEVPLTTTPLEEMPTNDAPALEREIPLEEIGPDEPSAIYHESTGELDIIHGRPHAGGST